MKTEQVHDRRPRLSAAIIVRNEQEVIAETLDSIRSIADEIIVWDSGSEDQTVSIARKKGAKVFQGFWKNDFSAARNSCMEKVSGQWVLWIDAGEKLTNQTAKTLRDFIDASADLQTVYTITVEIPPDDRCTAGEQIAQPRLLPVQAGLKFTGRVRETLYPAIQAAGLEIDAAPCRIFRHPRQHDQARKSLHANRNLGLLELEMIEKDKQDARIFLAQGEAYVNLGDYDRARDAFIRAIELSSHGSTEMLEGYYGLLTGYSNDPVMREAQIRVCLNALEVFPLDAQLLLAMGTYFQMHNRLDLASRAFETAVKFGHINSAIWHLCELPEVAASCLSMTMQLQGKNEEAGLALEEGLERNPHSARLQRLALELYIKEGKVEQALEMAHRNGTVSGSEDPGVLTIRGACKAAQQQWTPALAYLQSAYLMGCRTPMCLRWLAVTLLSNGQGEAAKPVLTEWQKLEPANPELKAYIVAVEEQRGTVAGKALVEPVNDTRMDGNTTIRQYRVDSGSTFTEVNPIKIPLVTPFTSSETPVAGET